MKTFLLNILIILASVTSAVLAESHVLDDRIVQVIVTYQEYNELMPWQEKNPEIRYGYGVLLDDHQVITTESLVRNNRLVELRMARAGEKIAVRVGHSDPEVNLALLQVPDGAKLAQSAPLKLCSKLPLDASVELIQFDVAQQLQRGQANVLRVGMAPLPKAPYYSLTYTLLAALDISGDGVGVIHNNELAGIIMDYERASRTGSMIPGTVIRHFLDNCQMSPYPGFASAGFRWKPLIDPSKRNFLNVGDNRRGILVLSSVTGTDASKVLKPDDVIIEWDGQPVDNLGFYDDAELGRINISNLIKHRRRPGDIVPLIVIRDKKATPLSITLCNRPDSDNLIPENTQGDKPEYIISGGFVIRELTGSYLRAHGNSWQQIVDPRLVHSYFTQKTSTNSPGERITILTGVLPDPINIGYQHFGGWIIEKVNNVQINNIRDVFNIISKEGCLSRLTLRSVGIDLVLDKDDLPSANIRIGKNYRIPLMQYQVTD